MLSGRYPSEDFAELRPRVVWQRDTGVLSARPGAQRLAVTSGGTIPDRGHVRRVPGRRGQRVGPARGGPAGRRARRGDGLRDPRQRRLHPRHDELAGRGDHPRPGARLPRARRARSAALLEGRRPRSAARAGAGLREVRARGRRPARRARRGPAGRGGAGRLRGRQPADLPARAGVGHRLAAHRPDDRLRAVPRRARRLAGLRALRARAPACSRPGRSPSSATPASATGMEVSGHRDERRHGAAGARHRVRPARRRPDHPRPGLDRGRRHRRGRRLGAVRVPVPRVRGPGAAAPPPRPQVALAAVAAADALGPAAVRRRAVPGVPHRPGDDARVPDRRLRPRRAARGPAPGRLAHAAHRRGRDVRGVALRPVAAVRLRRAPSSTRATSPSRRRRRRRSRSTPPCSPSCWARTGSSSCSTPTSSRAPRPTCRA